MTDRAEWLKWQAGVHGERVIRLITSDDFDEDDDAVIETWAREAGHYGRQALGDGSEKLTDRFLD